MKVFKDLRMLSAGFWEEVGFLIVGNFFEGMGRGEKSMVTEIFLNGWVDRLWEIANLRPLFQTNQ